MKANELRIGNLVFRKSDMFMSEVHSVWQSSVKLWCNPLALFKDYEIEPIPLSEEILLKVGFKYRIEFSNTYKWHLYANGLRVAIYLDNGKYFKDYSTWICNPNISNGWHVVGNISSVHQLQNLYFALTGQELNTSGL